MQYDFKGLVDIPKLQKLTDELYLASSIPSAVISIEGEVLTGSGWQRICTDFHRQNPQVERECIKSDTTIRKKMADGEPFAIYKCPRGLVDASSPVIIAGEHIANVFAGQVFLEPPNDATEQLFREQAHKFGFDETDYIKAFREVPIFTEERFRAALSFISKLAKMIADMGFTRLNELKSKDALLESEEKYRSIMDSMEDATYICSSDFRIEYMNPAMIKRAGYEAIGEACHEVMHGLDEKCPWCIAAKVMNGESIGYETVSPKDDKIFFISNSPIYHTDGSVSKLTVFRDITEYKKMEKSLQQAQKMEAIGTLAGGIAHDFNNILFPIVGYTEMLIEDIPEDSPYQESLNEIYAGAIRAKDLVKQILTFSRQKSADLILVKIQHIIKEALRLIRSSISAIIEIKEDVQADCGMIKADPTQIHQIIMNLATNAYHAMQETGGELKISLKEIKLDEHDIITPGMIPGGYACLTIADTGMGMDKALIEKIFDPFFTTKEIGKGTGMGLSVVGGIVKGMNGAVKVYSRPNKGTEFHVYLPIAENPIEKQKVETKEQIQEGTERILLVDDEEYILIMVKQMLERLGYQVTSRISSIETLETFRADPHKFDMVITDMEMPNMSGDNLAVELTRIRPDIPILLCTGFSEIISEEKAASLGIKGFLMKPIVIKDLAQKVNEVLGKN